MRIFTKSFLALALSIVCVGGGKSKETVIYSVDYSTMADNAGAPFWSGSMPTGASVNVSGGLLVINNSSDEGDNHSLQLWIGSGFVTTLGLDYRVKITYKTTTASSEGHYPSVGIGTWDYRATNYSVPLTVSGDFQTVSIDFKNFDLTATDNFIMWQSRKLVSTVSIKKVEVCEVIPDAPEVVGIYGDMKTVTPTFYVNGDGDTGSKVATPNGNGEYVIVSKNEASFDWDSQFWIGTPEGALPAGEKFHIEFKYKASDDATVNTQTHSSPSGGYLTWHCLGSDLSFTKEWKTFTQDVTLESDMAGWRSVAFNLNFLRSSNTYYFKDVVLQVPEKTGENISFTVGTVGWATYSSSKNVDLGTVKGYAASYMGSYIKLTPVTQVPAGDAVIIEAVGKQTFSVIPSATAITDNDLSVSDGSVTGDGSTKYALGKKGGVVGFVKVKDGVTIPAGKAYLTIPASARDFIGFADDETTGINAVEQATKSDNQYFNLAGQRVAQPTKGLYIVNGKKVIIK